MIKIIDNKIQLKLLPLKLEIQLGGPHNDKEEDRDYNVPLGNTI